ncbi:MAG: hypothetical protein AAFQ36_08700 [Pseudomonadota bacterium]
MIITETSTTPIDFGNATLYPVGDRFIVLENSGQTFSVYGSDGSQIVESAPLVEEHSFRKVYVPWYVRDDGDGAFTMFVLSGNNVTPEFLMLSFNADGTVASTGNYERPAFNADRGFGVVPLEDGKFFSVYPTMDRFYAQVFDSDGTILDTQVMNATDSSSNSRDLKFRFALAESDGVIFVFNFNRSLSLSNSRDANETFMFRFSVDDTDNIVRIEEERKISNGDHINGTFSSVNLSKVIDADTLSNGNVVVAYTSDRRVDDDDNPTPGDGGDIWIQIFQPDGTVVLEETLANDVTTGFQSEITLKALDAGGFVITYDNYDDLTQPANTVLVRTFDNDGTPRGPSEAPDVGHGFSYGEKSEFLGDGTGLIVTFKGGFPVAVATDAAGDPGDDDDDDNGGGDPVAGSPTNGDDEFDGTNKKDKVNLKNGDDVYRGLGGKDNIKGGNGVDTLNGGAGNDKIDGGKGDDVLVGEAGKDKLIGGAGDDTLTGGAGKDTFIFSKGKKLGEDTILDFNENQDRIDLSKKGLRKIEVTDDGLNTTIDYGKQGEIFLLGTVLTEDEINFI